MSFPLANKIEAECWRIAQRIDEIMEIDMRVEVTDTTVPPTDIHAPNHHCKRKLKVFYGNASDNEVWTQRDGLSIDCEQLVILIQKEED
ncbi:hypothetical protein IGI04_022024 [Brassica rapa subsp. trilocularis]|uniref:Uncharacterized protein n=1 Tax=Brassica rapa subsp. trilocularis TaxID=1813537 RepID=A0ABQ7M3W6_BRACM|nr:hypothetical protein IGI04_022024 [Brassica rapa subsp. trilocularis]